MKKLLASLLCVMMVFCMMPTVAFAEGTSTVSLEETSINTVDDLKAFSADVSAGNDYSGKVVKLNADIDLENAEWTPIGTWAGSFNGTFDGQGHTISNLKIAAPADPDGLGLFGVAQNATIQNLTVNNVNVVGNEMVAAVVGYADTDGEIVNCHVTGDINVIGNTHVAGILAYGKSDVKNCTVVSDSAGTITAAVKNAVGGVCGWLKAGHEISGCTVENLEITGYANVGAIAGFVEADNVIDNCSAENVALMKTRTTEGNFVVGLATGGWANSADKKITITNNSFRFVTVDGIGVAGEGENILYGSEYYGTNNPDIFILDNNQFTSVEDNTIAEPITGLEEENGAFLINNINELKWFRDKVNEGNDYAGQVIKLTVNINLNNAEWTPIGTWAGSFNGTFDGQGHTISNLKIAAPADPDGLGLFGVTQNATIQNLTVNNVNVVGNEMVAAVVGYADTDGEIVNCHVTGDINVIGNTHVAGILAYGKSDVKNCTVVSDSAGTITAAVKNAVGGVCGWLKAGHEISGCTVENLEITGYANVGAIAGFVEADNVIDNCSAENVILNRTQAGGNFTIGLAAGGWANSADKRITIINNAFDSTIMNSNVDVNEGADILHGSEYFGTSNPEIFVLDNNYVNSGTFNVNPISYVKEEVKTYLQAEKYYVGTAPAHSSGMNTWIKGEDGIYTESYVAPASPSTGGGYVSVEKPEIIADAGADYNLSILGTTLTITAKEGYELVDVTLNGVSKGAVTELKSLETGDKVVIVTKAIGAEEPVADEAQLVARSQMSKANGKKAIKVYWFNEDGSELTYDGYEIFRSTKRFKGYGTKPIFETERDTYWNTDIEMGTKYYYKIRGYNEVNGERVYSDWSLKAWRVAE